MLWGPSRHLGSLTAANWVSFDFNVSYSSCWGYSLINTLKLKKNEIQTSVLVSQCRRVFPCTFLMPMTRIAPLPLSHFVIFGSAIGLRVVKRSGSNQISRERRRRANGVRSRLISNWGWITAIGGSTEDELTEFEVVSDQSGRSSAVVGFVYAVANRKRGWQWPQGLTTLHHFLDTVLKKRVTRRLAAATAVAHDNGRPGTSGIWKRDLASG